MRDKRELSRSESARQRRTQRAVKELQQTGQRAVKPIQTVTKRVVATPMPKPTFVQVQKKRRFSIALGLPDIHLRRPNTGKQNPSGRWRAASLGIVVVIGLAIYLALSLPYFNIPSITVLGNNRLTREEITAATGVIGQSIFTVQPEDITTQLRLNYPELLLVEANVYLPNHVYVTVVEREPVILWQQNGAYTWVDATGVAFRPHGVVHGLVPVTGLTNPPQGTPPVDAPLSPPPYMQKELADAIVLLAPSVPADTTMIYDGTYGLGWEDARGWKVFFGAGAHDMALKVRVYQSLAQSLTEKNLSPVFINVAYPDAPYYRMAAEVEYKPVTESNGQ
jgi:cell division septal protein FtsQ